MLGAIEGTKEAAPPRVAWAAEEELVMVVEFASVVELGSSEVAGRVTLLDSVEFRTL